MGGKVGAAPELGQQEGHALVIHTTHMGPHGVGAVGGGGERRVGHRVVPEPELQIEQRRRLAGHLVACHDLCRRLLREILVAGLTQHHKGSLRGGIGDVLRLGDTFLLARQVPSTLRPAPPRGALASLSGDSPAMHQLRGELGRVGPEGAVVVLRGESGTGKGVSAAALHALSGRPGPLVSVNCAAIPEQLAESTLFGHVRGAFTGAERPHPGVFQEASGGTLFLDEVADLPLALQPKLLHAVEAGEVRPVGGARAVAVDLRIVTATSLDLEQAVAEGRFRGELLARLSDYVLILPPLRDRVEDVLPLFTARLTQPLHPDLVERLLLYPWPYNVRELQKVAAEVALRGLGLHELGPELLAGRLGEAPVPPGAGLEGEETPSGTGPPEREAVEAALRACQGQVAAAARSLSRSRRQLYRDLARLGLDPEDFRPGS